MAHYEIHQGLVLLRECGCRAAYGEDGVCLMLDMCREHLHGVAKAYGEEVTHLDVREFDDIYQQAKAALSAGPSEGA